MAGEASRHLLFENKILRFNGNEFENFFTSIMQSACPQFRQVKPSGQSGDRKNDGFIPKKGIYYQVYAPEDISQRNSVAKKKIIDDFKGLYKYWNPNDPIHQFYFVINDKFHGVSPDIYTQIEQIEKEYPSVKAYTFLVKDLQDVFFQLNDAEQNRILNLLCTKDTPDVENVALNEVIQYILNTPASFIKEKIPDNPDFDKKIVFNHLGDSIKNLLKTYQCQSYAVDDYFKYQEAQIKDNLRVFFTGLYQKSRKKITGSGQSDEIFEYIYDHAYPKSALTVATSTALYALMAYYFEYCDIFEPPK